MSKLPDLDEQCGANFVYRDFVECSKAWQETEVENAPLQPESYAALERLATVILDPVVERFGQISLTYGIAGSKLTRKISSGIAPRVDQHASFERSVAGKPICNRGGAACDFFAESVNSLSLAQWVVENTEFDRLYYYGVGRPIHVSASDRPIGQCVIVKRIAKSKKVLPTVIGTKKFLAIQNTKKSEES